MIRKIAQIPQRLLSRPRQWLLERRWRPALQRLRVELEKENDANRAMLQTYAHWAEGKADRTELKRANKQLREMFRTIGFGGLIILPFSPITIPWLIMMSNRLNIRLLPDWFLRSTDLGKKSKQQGLVATEQPQKTP